MLIASHPYFQASGNQLVETLKHLIDVYANVAAIIGAMLLVVLVWLCLSELQQSLKARRVGGPPAKRPTDARRSRARRLLEESSI